jgi:glutathione S-transferase
MLTLYDAARCPYCARARIVLAEKGVEHETVEIDLADRPAWIYEKNSTGRVPVLEEGAAERFDEQLARLDAALTERPWLAGGEYVLADIAYVPWLLRARDSLALSLDAQPAVQDWVARLLARPAVAAEAAVVAAL